MKPDDLSAQAAVVEQLLKALANRHRLMVLCELSCGERSVGELQARIGLGQSALSQHLARLRADGLVATRREAQAIYYTVASDKAVRIIGLLQDLYCSRQPGAGTASHGGEAQ